MLNVSEDDWKQRFVDKGSFPILERMLDGHSPQLHYVWIGNLYKKYRLGEWDNAIPDPKSIPDQTVLMDDAYYSYCLLHRHHDKFGENILECGHYYAKNMFVFVDYSILEPVFAALNADEDLPYIPVHHAQPEDRHDYKNGAPLWA